MPFTLTNLADHPDAELLAMIARNTDQLDRATIARNTGHDEAVRVVRGFGKEWVDTDDRIARTPAKTLDGLLSKAAYALHDYEPPKGGSAGIRGAAMSALHDLFVLQREG